MNDQTRADRLAHYMLRKINRAVRDYGLIRDGDRIAVALSGGKDSLTLLDMLEYKRRHSREDYTLTAIHIVGDSRGGDTPKHADLEHWLKDSGHEYRIRHTFVGDDDIVPLGCNRCARNRRRTLFETAVEMGCSRIAFGHHMDDLAETVLMNLFHHGRAETMPPISDYFDGRLTLIRPLVYVPEREILRFAAVRDFPPPPPPCPIGEHTERSRMKGIITGAERTCRGIRNNLLRAALGHGDRILTSRGSVPPDRIDGGTDL